MRSINLIVIHCSASSNGASLFSGKAGEPGFKTPVDVIDGWHAARGFKRSAQGLALCNPSLRHIGYHFVIATNGAIFTGRSAKEVGAHAQGCNQSSLGICMVGTDRYTPAQWQALADLLKGSGDPKRYTGDPITAIYQIPLRSPSRRLSADRRNVYIEGGICGHRDLSPDQNRNGTIEKFEWLKTCPGFDVAAYLARGCVPAPENILKGD